MIQNRTLLIPDLHNNVGWVNDFLKTQTYTEVVFLGDYFDDWHDSRYEAKATALWLKDALNLPNSHFLLGNHDLAYRFPVNAGLSCSGFTKSKCRTINSILLDDWTKFKLCHYTQGFLCSHAGISDGLFVIPPEIEDIEDTCRAAIDYAQYGQTTTVLGCGYARGGNQPIGGIVWCDWIHEFRPLKGINQIMGHTPDREVRCITRENSINYCIDCKATKVGVIEDGKFSVINSGISLPTRVNS